MYSSFPDPTKRTQNIFFPEQKVYLKKISVFLVKRGQSTEKQFPFCNLPTNIVFLSNALITRLVDAVTMKRFGSLLAFIFYYKF